MKQQEAHKAKIEMKRDTVYEFSIGYIAYEYFD
jgi:hypothetical protein